MSDLEALKSSAETADEHFMSRAEFAEHTIAWGNDLIRCEGERDDLQRRVTALVSELVSCRSGRDTERAERLAEQERIRALEIVSRNAIARTCSYCKEARDALETR